MHQNEISFPFRRYQMQPVWRADRPQKGRYREFYQCDADVVGSNSLINEVELTQIYLTVFEKLGIVVEVRLNHRKILAGLAESCGGESQTTNITTAIDKLDKIGIEKVKEELLEKNLNNDQVAVIEKYLHIDGNNSEKIQQLTSLIPNKYTKTGLEDLQYILKFFNGENPEQSSGRKQKSLKDSGKVVLDFSLARGLNYYTGIIFEVRAKGVNIGSIGGGGRYDDLTGLFGLRGIPGVGISFGVDRIYDVMEELKLFLPAVQRSTQVLFFNLGEEAALKSFELMQKLRKEGIRSELYHGQAKFDKQFKYAEKKRIPFVVIIGSDELSSGLAKIKDLKSGVQREVGFEEIISIMNYGL
jgi:histidyl-tRNA synthetase